MKFPLSYILLALLLACCSIVHAKPKTEALTAEEQMRLDYYLYAALQASERNEHARAYFMLELCYAIDPANPTVCSMRGAYIQSLFGKEQALPLLRTAYEGSPDDYWLRYAVTAYETGHKNTAMQVLKTMRKRNPKDIDVLELYEHINLKEGKLKQAIASRDAIDKLTGEATEQSVITRFNILREAGKRAEAFRVLDNYLQRDPNNGRIRAIRQEHAYSEATAKGNAAEARELLNQLLDNADIPLQRKIYYVTNCKERAGYTPTDIRAMLSELREQYPYEQQIYQAMFDFEQNDMHNPTGALEIGRTMLTMNPTDATLREQIANLMRDDSTVTVEEVGAFIDESYAVLPDNPKWGYFKALRCWQQGDEDSTLAVLSHALLHAEEPMVKLELLLLSGDLHGHLKHYDQALQAYEEALKLAPEHTILLNNYAWTLAISGGDLKKAEKLSQRTITKDATNPTYLDTYAWILHLQGENNMALFYIKRAMEYVRQDDGTIAEHYQQIEQSIRQKK